METILQVIPEILAMVENLEMAKTSQAVEILAVVETFPAVEILAVVETSQAVEILAAVVSVAVVSAERLEGAGEQQARLTARAVAAREEALSQGRWLTGWRCSRNSRRRR